MKTRMIVLALLLCLTLTACGGKKTDSQSQDFSLNKAEQVPENEPLLSVDGREIPAWRYLYWLEMACRRLQEQYAAADM